MSQFTQAIDSLFARSGQVARLPQFEYRAQQHQMAVEIADALEHGDHCIIEAPTGSGKTEAALAYAVKLMDVGLATSEQLQSFREHQ